MISGRAGNRPAFFCVLKGQFGVSSRRSNTLSCRRYACSGRSRCYVPAILLPPSHISTGRNKLNLMLHGHLLPVSFSQPNAHRPTWASFAEAAICPPTSDRQLHRSSEELGPPLLLRARVDGNQEPSMPCQLSAAVPPWVSSVIESKSPAPASQRQEVGRCARQVAARASGLLGRHMPYYLHGLRGLMDNALSGVVPASCAWHSYLMWCVTGGHGT